MEIEGEFGFRVEEAVAALRRSFPPPGWECGEERDGLGVRVRLTAGAALLEIALEPLPDRTIGPTLKLPRLRLVARIIAPEPAVPELIERLRLSLHRGGG